MKHLQNLSVLAQFRKQEIWHQGWITRRSYYQIRAVKVKGTSAGSNTSGFKSWLCFLSGLTTLGDILNSFKHGFLIHVKGTVYAGKGLSCPAGHHEHSITQVLTHPLHTE